MKAGDLYQYTSNRRGDLEIANYRITDVGELTFGFELVEIICQPLTRYCADGGRARIDSVGMHSPFGSWAQIG